MKVCRRTLSAAEISAVCTDHASVLAPQVPRLQQPQLRSPGHQYHVVTSPHSSLGPWEPDRVRSGRRLETPERVAGGIVWHCSVGEVSGTCWSHSCYCGRDQVLGCDESPGQYRALGHCNNNLISSDHNTTYLLTLAHPLNHTYDEVVNIVPNHTIIRPCIGY